MKKIIITVFVVLFVALAAAGGFLLYQSNQQAGELKEKEGLTALRTDVTNLNATGKYDEGLNKVNAYLATAKDPKNKLEALLHKGALLETSGKHREARDVYREAEAVSEERQPGVIVGIARTSEQIGDKKMAAVYYHKAADVFQSQGAAESFGNFYRVKAKALEKS